VYVLGFKLANIGGRAALTNEVNYYDVETISGGSMSSDPMVLLGSSRELDELSLRLNEFDPTGPLDSVALAPPVPRPGNCYAVGLNYRNHAEEANLPIPPVPMVFTKHTNCITGPTQDIVMKSDFVDYEAELVAVIGKDGKDISLRNAYDHIAGFCVGQDISDRPVQFSATPPQFNLGKSFDTFGPIGPVVTSLSGLQNYESLEIECEVSGELRQKDNTRELIFDIPALVAYLSEIVTLRSGDIIFTGTPSGVGAVSGKFLRHGDILSTTIHGLGTLKNRCVRAADHSRADVIPENLTKLLKAARSKKTL
tara:strand:- start:201 stop:1130 length:930 start_codon:yes stop_codon:yes gene_type:complete